ncbi:MAG: HD domain-containing protein, partial [Emcibacteraceae bacterium]|nr:HD domain-containing protein [Emcibacteraceae bacterium]
LRKLLEVDNIQNISIFFILNSMKRRELIQANALGAAEFVSHPIDPDEFQKKLKEIANNTIEQSWENLNPIQAAALKASLKVFEDTFESLRNGEPLPDKEIRESCDLLIKATAEEGIDDMLSSIRTHHNCTYRHSMMVSGYLVAFALLIGVKGQDLQNVAVGGILHDIGKALISAEILDKPTALNDQEWAEMQKHPEHSREILKNSNCHKDVIEASIHHHENLTAQDIPMV